MIRKLLCVFFIGSVLVAAGCGKKQETSSNRDRIKWAIFGEVNMQQFAETVKKWFETENPGSEIELEMIAGAAYDQKILTEFAGGTSPDVFWIGSFLPAYAEKGALFPLDKLLESDKEFDRKSIYPPVLDLFKYKGELYALPADFANVVMYYNKNLFDRNKLKYPDSSWDQKRLVEMAKKLTADENGDGKTDIFGLAMSYRWWFIWQSFVWQQGGEIYNKEATESAMDNPKTIEAIQFLSDLIHQYKVVPSQESLEGRSDSELFKSGKIAMFIGGSFAIGSFIKDIKNFNWDIALLPKKVNRASNLTGGGYAISSKTKNPDLAWKFVKYLQSEKVLKYRIDEPGLFTIPANKKFANSDMFLKKKPPENIKVLLETIENSRCVPPLSGALKIDNIQIKELDRVWYGFSTAGEACRAIKKQVDLVLREK